MMAAHGFYCCVDSCKSHARDHVPFFRFPKDPIRCQQWKEILGFTEEHKYANLTSEEAHSRVRICSKHFDNHSFTLSRKRLLNAAVPSRLLLHKLDDYNKQDSDKPSPSIVQISIKLDASTQTDIDTVVAASTFDIKTWDEDVAQPLQSYIPSGFNPQVEICRQKWRNLRDVFRRELRKFQARLENPNIVDKTQPRWHFFKDLQFLTDQILGADNIIPELRSESPEEQYESFYVVGSRSTVKKEPDFLNEEDVNNDEHNDFLVAIDREEDHDGSPSKMTSVDGMMLKRSHPETLEDGRKRRRLINREREDDSDYYFLMSLLPFVKAVPNERKLEVRNKMQSILYEELSKTSDN